MGFPDKEMGLWKEEEDGKDDGDGDGAGLKGILGYGRC